MYNSIQEIPKDIGDINFKEIELSHLRIPCKHFVCIICNLIVNYISKYPGCLEAVDSICVELQKRKPHLARKMYD